MKDLIVVSGVPHYVAIEGKSTTMVLQHRTYLPEPEAHHYESWFEVELHGHQLHESEIEGEITLIADELEPMADHIDGQLCVWLKLHCRQIVQREDLQAAKIGGTLHCNIQPEWAGINEQEIDENEKLAKYHYTVAVWTLQSEEMFCRLWSNEQLDLRNLHTVQIKFSDMHVSKDKKGHWLIVELLVESIAAIQKPTAA